MTCADVIILDKGAERYKWECRNKRSWPARGRLSETPSLVSSSLDGVRVKEPETVKVDCRVPAQRRLGQSEAHAAPGWFLFFTLYRSLHQVVFLSQRHLSRPDIIVPASLIIPQDPRRKSTGSSSSFSYLSHFGWLFARNNRLMNTLDGAWSDYRKMRSPCSKNAKLGNVLFRAAGWGQSTFTVSDLIREK